MSSILEATPGVTDAATGSEPGSAVEVPPPYRSGDRICATSPEGIRFLARVEAVKRTLSGEFTIVAAVTEPRRYRSHLLTTLVGADGYGPAVRPVI
jgi:hypothetical protein